MDYMIDIETLGTTPKAVVLQIGVVAFDGSLEGVYYLSELAQNTREVSNATSAWWCAPERQLVYEGNSRDFKKELDRFVIDIKSLHPKTSVFWAKSPSFDQIILEDLLEQYEYSAPWNYWQWRDVRTALNLGVSYTKLPASHDALEDCRNQVSEVQEVLHRINLYIPGETHYGDVSGN
jgi:hypothetical protein